jgi:hypothetical protein
MQGHAPVVVSPFDGSEAVLHQVIVGAGEMVGAKESAAVSR